MAKLLFLLFVASAVLAAGLVSASPGILSQDAKAHKIWANWFLKKPSSTVREDKLKEIRKLSPFPAVPAKAGQRFDVCLTDACIESCKIPLFTP